MEEFFFEPGGRALLLPLRESLSCPVCSDLFRDPVMVAGCGHNLCRACAAKCWAPLERSLRCPQCREPLPLQRLLLQPNEVLGGLAQQLRSRQAGQGSRRTRLPGGSPTPRPAPLPDPPREPAEEEEEEEEDPRPPLRLGEQLEFQDKSRREGEAGIHLEEQREELLKQMEVEKQQVIWEWKVLRGYLEELERHWLNHLEELKRDIVRRCDGQSEDSLLHKLFGEQGSEGRPTLSLQDFESSSNSMEDGVLKIDFTITELKQRLTNFSWKRAVLQEALLRLKEELQLEMNGDTGYRIASSFQSTLSHLPQEDGREMSTEMLQSTDRKGDADSRLLVFQELATFKRTSVLSETSSDIPPATPKNIKEEEEAGVSPEHIGVLNEIKKEEHEQMGPEPVELQATRLPRLEGNTSQSFVQITVEGQQGNNLAKSRGPRRGYGEAAARKHKEKCYPCPDCGKIFRQFGVLITHHRLHTGEKPYSCAYCAKGFSDYSNLIAHQRTHTGEKPYRCADCGKSFTRSTTLTIHRRGHTREKPFLCPQCGKRFSRASNLTIHQRTHAGERNQHTVVLNK